MPMNKQIEAMRKLGMTDEELKDVLDADKRIDRGEKLFELTDEQKQAEKKARQADRSPTVYKFQKRERKADEAKRFLLEALVGGIADSCAVPVEVANPEREFSFMFEGKKYKVVLSAPRS